MRQPEDDERRRQRAGERRAAGRRRADAEQDGQNRPDARAAAPDAGAARGFTLAVSPADAEVKLGDGPWQRFVGGGATTMLPSGTKPRSCRNRNVIGPTMPSASMPLAFSSARSLAPGM